MEIKEKDYSYQSVFQMDDEVTSSRKFLAKVFLWMFGALALSSVLAYVFAFDASLQAYLRDPFTLKPTGLGTLAMFSPLAFVLIMSFGFNRLSFGALAAIFVAYAAVFGISMSTLFIVYSGASIFNVFLTATILFGVMAVAGYTTKTDLTKFGSLLFIALIALVISSLINTFVGSGTFDYILSLAGVAIFTGLTAYDVQKLKRIGAGIEQGSAPANKLAVMGALTLYLDFVNLFLFLLRLFGNRK